MKYWRPAYIRQAETLQLILLTELFARKEGAGLYFQGGTALRWCYGGGRFSEDLDFETRLQPKDMPLLLSKVAPAVRRHLAAHLGPGRFELQLTRCDAEACKARAKFSPSNIRGNIAVKLEFQRLSAELMPETQPIILGSLPAVAEQIRDGRLQSRPGTILLVETLPEILAGKTRALLERPSYKGRDFWDIWFLVTTTGIQLNATILARKFRLYPFTPRRLPQEVLRDLTERRDATLAVIRDDLARFVPPETLAVLEHTRFEPLVDATRKVLAACSDELVLPSP